MTPQAADLTIVMRQWYELVGVPLQKRRTNLLSNRHEREDSSFHLLAERAFDDADFLEQIGRMSAQWLSRCPCETTRAIAAYAAYLRGDYARAATHLQACIAENPTNLDNWIDLGFALNHQGNRLGRHILFNHTEYIARFEALGARVCTLSCLQTLRDEIDREGADYGKVWPRHVEKPPPLTLPDPPAWGPQPVVET